MRGFRDQIVDCLPDLWRYAFSLTRDRDAADDLVQDSVERALRKRQLWASDRAVKPWLMTILLNLFRNAHRPGARPPTVPFSDNVAAPQTLPDAEARLELDGLLARIAALPADQREPLLLVAVGGMRYAECAEALSIPMGTVMSRIARARAALRSDTPPRKTTLRSVK